MSNHKIDEDKLVEQLNSICRKFEDQWSPDLRPDFEPFLLQVDDPYRSRLLQWLLEADVELRRTAGQVIEPSDYQQFGADAVELVRKFIDGGLISKNRTKKQPAVTDPSPPLNSSGEMQVGPYKLLQQIGECDLAIIAMSHYKLGNTEEANDYRKQLTEAMSRDDFKDNEDCLSFQREVNELFDESK